MKVFLLWEHRDSAEDKRLVDVYSTADHAISVHDVLRLTAPHNVFYTIEPRMVKAPDFQPQHKGRTDENTK